MVISTIVKTVIPNTYNGYNLAANMEKRIKEEGSFVKRTETSKTITIVEMTRIILDDEVNEC